ncbi:FkbM family methyltransferase [Streptomyces sp. NRRL S-1022]|uniref:FkbM family methyltransferase n=1 Tax=Streptomyces sp. NRRL S-1022 TaxID=1463880 RepID=UPI00068F89FD|nr:FkbM family methyltransferase [Streptomyces sp. NRRL S-1022]
MTGPGEAPAHETYEITLPGGRKVLSPEANQGLALWQDVVGNDVYARAVDGLSAGDVVFDVGANIGFAACLFTDLVPGLRVYSFEPAEACYACLQVNAARLRADITAVRAAVGAEPGTAELTYYPKSPAQSSLYPDSDEDRRNSTVYLVNSGIGAEAADVFLADMHRGHSYPVAVTTVAAALDEYGVDELALLKIDVERAEQDVLDGVGEAGWSRVRRVVAEVHDTDGRLDSVTRHLSERGFEVEVGQERLLAGTNVHMLLAARDR